MFYLLTSRLRTHVDFIFEVFAANKIRPDYQVRYTIYLLTLISVIVFYLTACGLTRAPCHGDRVFCTDCIRIFQRWNILFIWGSLEYLIEQFALIPICTLIFPPGPHPMSKLNYNL